MPTASPFRRSWLTFALAVIAQIGGACASAPDEGPDDEAVDAQALRGEHDACRALCRDVKPARKQKMCLELCPCMVRERDRASSSACAEER